MTCRGRTPGHPPTPACTNSGTPELRDTHRLPLVAEDARAWGRAFGIRYLHTDVIGTPIAKTDEAGSVIERDRRQSFGQPFAGSLRRPPDFE